MNIRCALGGKSIGLGFANVRLSENVSYGLGRVSLTPIGGLVAVVRAWCESLSVCIAAPIGEHSM
ncbi:hypothetical protein, partial [Escherichia coli]|uniref:hypothetical protein n=1 Tax=Escherichia coli TaxID=562 RepID=UPI003F44BC37